MSLFICINFLERKNSIAINNNIFDDLPSHKKLWTEIFDGGVKSSTNNKYIEKYTEFLRTMKRLGFNNLMWNIPIEVNLIYVYIMDCILRKKSNVWDTIRNKLRALDYVNQLCGINSSWSDDFNIQMAKKYVKKNNPSLGSKVVPIRRKELVIVYNHLMYKLLGNFVPFVNISTSGLVKIFDKKINYKLSCLVTWMMVSATGGFRIGELVHADNLNNNDYGLMRKDIKFGYVDNNNNISFDNKRKDRSNLFIVEFILRNSKTQKKNQSIRVWMGRSKFNIDPILMIFDLYYGQKVVFNNINNNSFLFIDQNNIPITIAEMRNLMRKALDEIGLINREHFPPHCLRKSYNITLSRCGVSEGLIAYGGRWTLAQAYFRYAVYSLDDLIGLAKIYWCGDDSKGLMVDIDEKVGFYFKKKK